MLGDETRTEQLKTLARDFRHDRGVIQKPPTTKRHQVVELPRRHTQLVLILARKKCRQKLHVMKLGAQPLERFHIRAAHPVTRVSKLRVYLSTDADHQR